MVFTSVVNFVRSKGPDEFWRKRKIFKLSAHFIGRRRNCYSIAVRNVHRALQYARIGRKLKKIELQELWQKRVEAGCQQYGISFECFWEALSRSNILLNRKTLADLAAWEPRSFESLVKISRERALTENIPGLREPSIMNQVYGLDLITKKNN